MMSRFENIPSISAMRRRSLDRSVAIDMPGNGEPCLRGRNVTFMHCPAMNGLAGRENRARPDFRDGCSLRSDFNHGTNPPPTILACRLVPFRT